MLKKDKLRYNEYYDMQHIYDELYAQSKMVITFISYWKLLVQNKISAWHTEI